MVPHGHVAVEQARSIVWLDEHTVCSRSNVGGKAAQLSRLVARHRVPPGFCITTDACTWWPTETCPPTLEEELRAALAILSERLGSPDPWLAVRSSAVEEDGSETSYAGQFETILGVRGPRALIDAIHSCRASASSERVGAYRRARGLHGPALLSVLVQALIPADVSFVAFSVNPLNGAAEVMINASWGLGESIVGGTTTPDTFVVLGEGVASRRLGAKERMTVLTPAGTREVPVPRLLREQASLTDAQAVDVASLARCLHDEHGHPVDIEGAVWRGELYLLQCRPITSLNAARESREGRRL